MIIPANLRSVTTLLVMSLPLLGSIQIPLYGKTIDNSGNKAVLLKIDKKQEEARLR